MRIGVYGGTFNPIHQGHLQLALEYARRLSLDKVLLIPANIPPHKRAVQLLSPGPSLLFRSIRLRSFPDAAEAFPMELFPRGLPRPRKPDALSRRREARASPCAFA